MRLCHLLLSLFLSFSLQAAAPTLRQEILGQLPLELRQLSPQDTQKVLEQKFAGKIRSKEKNALFLSYFGQDNDVTIGLKDGRFEYLYIKIPGTFKLDGKKLFDQALNSLTPAEKKAQIKRWDQEDHSHRAGRFLSIDLPKEKMKLEFKRNESREVNSLVYWPLPGGKK